MAGASAPSDLESSTQAIRARWLIRRAPYVCGGVSIAVGAIVLAGWWLHLPRLTSIASGMPGMVANAALMAGLLGIALILSASNVPGAASRRGAMAGKVCAGIVGGIAAATLVQYVFDLDLAIDQLLVSTGEMLVGNHPGRPAAQTAVAFLLAAAALLSLGRTSTRGRSAAEILALASGLISLVAALGYLFGAAALYGSVSLLPYVGMAIPTAAALLALSAGIAAAGIHGGVLSILMEEDSGGTTARHLAVSILVLVPVVCAIAIGARFGLYAAPLASALVVLLGSVVASALVLRVSWRLSRLDAKRREADVIRARLASVVGGSQDAIIAERLDGRITDWNAGAERLLGYTAAEMVGRDSSELLPPDRRSELDAIRDAARRGERPGAFEDAWRHKDGRPVPVYLTISPLLDGAGRVFGVSAIARDITARKRLEEEQAFLAEVGSILASTLELEATLTSIGRLVTRALADVCIVYAMEQDHEVRRIEVVTKDPSHRWIRDLLMQTAIDRRHAPAMWSELEAHRSVLLERLPPEMIASFAQDETHLRALHAMNMSSGIMVPLVAHGRLVGAMALISSEPSRPYLPVDVRFAEQVAQPAAFAIENARLYAEAQRAIRTRDDVLGIVAHDLRNPLGTILLQAVRLQHPGAAPESARKPAELIDRCAKRMSRLIDDLLDVTRMEAGRLPIEQVRIAAGELVGHSVEAQRPLAAAASVELQVDVARDLPDVWADRDRLQQVFENLIGNAVKFTRSGGAIVVGAASRAEEVMFWVADTGAGITGEDLPRVFDRFWQARRPGRHGAGLGLPIAKGIVEAHGGRIWVESTPGQGSTFFFTIPPAPGAEERPAP